MIYELRARWSDDPEWEGLVHCFVMNGEKVVQEFRIKPGALGKEEEHHNLVINGGSITTEFTAWKADCRKELGVQVPE